MNSVHSTKVGSLAKNMGPNSATLVIFYEVQVCAISTGFGPISTKFAPFDQIWASLVEFGSVSADIGPTFRHSGQCWYGFDQPWQDLATSLGTMVELSPVVRIGGMLAPPRLRLSSADVVFDPAEHALVHLRRGVSAAGAGGVSPAAPGADQACRVSLAAMVGVLAMIQPPGPSFGWRLGVGLRAWLRHCSTLLKFAFRNEGCAVSFGRLLPKLGQIWCEIGQFRSMLATFCQHWLTLIKLWPNLAIFCQNRRPARDKYFKHVPGGSISSEIGVFRGGAVHRPARRRVVFASIGFCTWSPPLSPRALLDQFWSKLQECNIAQNSDACLYTCSGTSQMHRLTGAAVAPLRRRAASHALELHIETGPTLAYATPNLVDTGHPEFGRIHRRICV